MIRQLYISDNAIAHDRVRYTRNMYKATELYSITDILCRLYL